MKLILGFLEKRHPEIRFLEREAEGRHSYSVANRVFYLVISLSLLHLHKPAIN